MPPSHAEERTLAAGSAHPLVFEVGTRAWLSGLAHRIGRPVDLGSVPDDVLDAWQARGFTHVWLMGVWPSGPLGRAQALREPDLLRAYDESLPGWRDQDVQGSPYAIAAAEVAPVLGGDAGLARLRKRLGQRGLGLLLDFVPNHLGLDHPWADRYPERFVSSREPLPESLERGGHWLAYGKDPYFPAWTDTLQLDHRRRSTREAMIGMLRGIATRCDGVRCDMAMLVLADVFARTWSQAPPVPDEDRARGEFWSEAIAAVRRESQDFLFVAEAYWGLEGRLEELGFDYTYDKTLYDHLVHARASEAQQHLASLGPARLARGVHFLENHDEPRAAASFASEAHRAAALLALGLPGMRLLHDGQLEGARRFARVQLGRRAEEPADPQIVELYGALLAALPGSAVGRGAFALLQPEPAWEGEPTHRGFVVVAWWQAPPAFDLVVVNLGAERARCRVRPGVPGLDGARYRMADRLGSERYEREGREMREAGLYLELAGNAAQLFRFTPY